MSIVLGKRSRGNMLDLHPDLVRVIERAAALAVPEEDFTILEGVRSKEQCWINYGKGRTAAECMAKGVPVRYAKPAESKVTWLSNPLASKHCRQKDGYGHAFDAAPYPIDWNDLKRFDRLAKLIFRAAKLENVKIRWGRDWDGDGRPGEKGETDSPHFELVL